MTRVDIMTNEYREPNSLGERCIGLAMTELENGVRSDNAYRKGPNISPRISEYLGGCMRDGSNGVGRHLAKTGANWCMAGQSWLLERVFADASYEEVMALPDDIYDGKEVRPFPHGNRAGVLEAVFDAKAHGIWVPVSEWTNETVQRGDLAIWDRRDGKPEHEWWRHVNRVLECGASDPKDKKLFGYLKTIGGNESGRKWNIAIQPGDSIRDKLLGFIQYPRVPKPKPLFSDEERADLRAKIDQCHAVIAHDWRGE